MGSALGQVGERREAREEAWAVAQGEMMRPDRLCGDAERRWSRLTAAGLGVFLPGYPRYCICHRFLKKCPAQDSPQLLSRKLVSGEEMLGTLKIPSLRDKPHFQHT